MHDATASDLPACIAPEEASQVAEQQWASLVEHRIKSRGPHDANACDVCILPRCVMLEFSRHPCELEDALLASNVAKRAQQQGVEILPP